MTELWAALQDHSLKAIDKLKVACHLWKHECVTSSRKDTLIRWAFEEICSAHSKKNKTPPPLEVYCKLWQLLSVMLESTFNTESQLRTVLMESANVHFFQSMMEVFTWHENSQMECSLHALKCLCLLMNGSSLPSVLHKYEITASLLETLLNFGMNHIHNDDRLLPSLLPPLKSLLCYYTYLQGTQGNQKKVFTTACTKLLHPVLGLRRELECQVDNHNETGDTIQCVDAIIHTLFNRDHLPEFLSAVTAHIDPSQKQKRTAVSYTRVLFETLEQLATSEQSTVVSGIPVIYGSFLEQNSKEQKLQKNVEFKFFRKILHLLNINEPLSVQHEDVAMETEDYVSSSVLKSISKSFLLNLKLPPSPSCLKEKGASVTVLTSLSQCLQLLIDYNIYQAAEDLASGGEQYSLLKELTAVIMGEVQPQNVLAVFKCLSAILKLNHKLVEPWLLAVWIIVFTGNFDLSKKMEPLCRDCILTYSKLRQLPALIQQMFEALNLLNELLPDLPHTIPTTPSLTLAVEGLIGDQLSILPPGQSVEILEIVNKHILKKYLAKCNDGGCVQADSTELSASPRYQDVSLLERTVDIARVVLSHSAPAIWAGREKEKALLLLQNLSEDICSPLLSKAATSRFDHALVSSSLFTVIECCELMSRIHTECPQLCLQLDWPVKLVWLKSSQLPVPEQWTTLEGCNQLGERGVYLLKKLAVFHLKFVPDCPVNPSTLLEFILQRSTPINCHSVWSGQLVDIDHQTISVAQWSLVLSQLVFFYEHCTTEQLASVAEGVVSSLVEGEGVRVCGGDCVSLCDVVEHFLASEGLMEMRKLQELLVVKCISFSMSVLRKILPKPLKNALKLCTKGASKDTLATALHDVLRDSIDKNYHVPDDLQTARLMPIFKVLRGVALSSLGTDLQIRSLVAIIVCHVTSVHAVLSTDAMADYSLHSLEELNYLLAWTILSLTDNEHSTLPVRKKKVAQRESERCLNPVLDLLLHWLYAVMISLAATVSGKRLKDVEVSNMVAMEILVGARMKLGGYPQEFTILISSDLSSEDMLTSAVAEQCLYIITSVTCKAYQVTTAKPIRSELRPSLDHLCEVVLRAMKWRTEDERQRDVDTTCTMCSRHPVLVSTLAAVLHCIGSAELAGASKIMQVVSRLYDSENSKMVSVLSEDGENLYLHYRMLCGMVDLLSLPAALRPSLSPDSEEATKKEADDDVPKSCDLSIVSSWQRLHQVLSSFFEHLNSVSEALHILGCSRSAHTSNSLTSCSQARDINKTLSDKFSKGLSLLLTAANKEEIEAMFEQLLQMEMNSVPSVCVFCYCWRRVLDCKLSQENRRVLRSHLYKVLFACQSITCQHPSNLLAVIAAVHLSSRLLSIPSQVGLDSGSVLSSLQFCVFISSADPTCSFTTVLIEVVAELMLALLRQHLHVAKSSPAPVITAANKLLEATMKETLPARQEKHHQNSNIEDGSVRHLVHCANQLTRIMDMMSRQKEFTKFAVYTVYKFIKTLQNQPIHPEVKTALLPGTFSLLKLCTQKDLAFIKASVSSEERDSLLTLIEEHQKFYKFGGRV